MHTKVLCIIPIALQALASDFGNCALSDTLTNISKNFTAFSTSPFLWMEYRHVGNFHNATTDPKLK